MARDASFEVDVSPATESEQTLLVGLTSMGVAGLTAADYLVRHHDSEQLGHVSPADLPAITPVEDGVPRHHTRLYNLADIDVTVLVSELFVPVWAARSFVDALLDWVAVAQVEEIAVLHAVPYPHGPDEHAVYTVATETYRSQRLDDLGMRPLAGGFLDGIPGELVSRSLDDDAPPVGVYVTPAHPPGPDIDAALFLLDAIEQAYGISVDLQELEDLSDSIHKHYAALAERMDSLRDTDTSSVDREFAEDRMFM